MRFVRALGTYFSKKVWRFLKWLEKIKSESAAKLYFQRGRYARIFTHSGVVLMVLTGFTLGPKIISEGFPSIQIDAWEQMPPASVLSASAVGEGMETETLTSIKPRADIIEYTVQAGDTISTISEKFDVSIDSIRWVNNLASVKTIKPGQILKIPPVTGIVYKVARGDTVYSIAKKFSVDAQVIVDWPYNSFSNDETFELAAAQTIVIPDGVMPKEVPAAPKYYAQVPGAGLGTGAFLWPTSGKITQNFSWYHRALDIASQTMPAILAADSGRVILAGWVVPVAYGNRVMIDHGNGYVTLYAHMSEIHVSVGQQVARGQDIGRMGSTGRSTGPHLHFEIRKDNVCQTPLAYLK